MKKLFPLVIILVVFTISCDEESQNQIANIKTVSDRINDLNKSMQEIKDMEDNAALMREEKYLLEYEYPIREDESFVVTYRFKNNKCFEIKLDTYLEKESYAKKIQQEVMTDMTNNLNFSKTTYKEGTFYWQSKNNDVKVELTTQNVERGTINLYIVINQ